jgi:AcrR family transcriptional regulator
MPSPRRRGAALEAAIVRAATDELMESGYAGLTMDRVARRAGTNKELLRRANSNWSSPLGGILRALLVGARDDPQLLAQIQENAADGGSAAWLAVLERAVARGEAKPEALKPRVATVPIALLRNEFVISGYPNVADSVLVEIIDDVYLPLVCER